MEGISLEVAVRIRPLLSQEVLDNHQVCVRKLPYTQQIAVGNSHTFMFDFVFDENATQDDIYTRCIRSLVIALLEGYNATIFTYGQTGSGKTYTMGGEFNAGAGEEQNGIIPRAIQELFQRINWKSHNTDFQINVSYMEIINEELRDLLEDEASAGELCMREDEKGNTVIDGLKEAPVRSPVDVMNLLEMGNAATIRRNAQSPPRPSHLVLMVSVCQQQVKQHLRQMEDMQYRLQPTLQVINSKFLFVDLAGPERAPQAGSAPEACGLPVLETVINTLGDSRNKNFYVPYHDSKITRVLKDSLGGSAKTVMVVCVDPSHLGLDGSLKALQLASMARGIRNRPVVNYNVNVARMNEMENEIRYLQDALQNQEICYANHFAQMTESLNLGVGRIRSLEDLVTRLQIECSSYMSSLDEAHALLSKAEGAGLGESQRAQRHQWLQVARELLKKSPDAVGATGGSPPDGAAPQPREPLGRQVDETVACQPVKAHEAQFISVASDDPSEVSVERPFCAYPPDNTKQFRKGKREPSTLKRRRFDFRTSSKRNMFSRAANLRTRQRSNLSQQKNQKDTEVFSGEKMESLKKNKLLNWQKKKISTQKLLDISQKIKAFTRSIKIKEGLMKELRQTASDAKSEIEKLSLEVPKLEQEATRGKEELTQIEKHLRGLELKDDKNSLWKKNLQEEIRKKSDALKQKSQLLQKNRLESADLTRLFNMNKKRATEVEQTINDMKHQQAQLQKKMREESKRKSWLEEEMRWQGEQIRTLEAARRQQRETEAAAMDSRNNLHRVQVSTSQESEEKLKLQIKTLQKTISQQEQVIRKLGTALEHLLQCISCLLSLRGPGMDQKMQQIVTDFKAAVLNESDGSTFAQIMETFVSEIGKLQDDLINFKKSNGEPKKEPTEENGSNKVDEQQPTSGDGVHGEHLNREENLAELRSEGVSESFRQSDGENLAELPSEDTLESRKPNDEDFLEELLWEETSESFEQSDGGDFAEELPSEDTLESFERGDDGDSVEELPLEDMSEGFKPSDEERFEEELRSEDSSESSRKRDKEDFAEEFPSEDTLEGFERIDQEDFAEEFPPEDTWKSVERSDGEPFAEELPSEDKLESFKQSAELEEMDSLRGSPSTQEDPSSARKVPGRWAQRSSNSGEPPEVDGRLF
ncbi:kinesin-like protein KIF27 isoform X2 [Ornithorhynchus anatinus]|uniref:Kinesin family member 27 n=1 Tax=Ornithorhynchus anatinus TaxID=9258 RepID=F7CSB1_ORNAN|nr:kinesin-like protein KIF27 isoform X2 [Ornithorhynchus anatinus]